MNNTSKKTSFAFIKIIFRLFTFAFVVAVPLFVSMLFNGSSLLYSSCILITVGVSIPSTLLVIFIHFYSLIEAQSITLHSHPLIRVEKSGFALIRSENKLFDFLLSCCVFIIAFYFLSIIPFAKTLEFIHNSLRLMLIASIVFVCGVMAINGFYVYFNCLFELFIRFCENKNIHISLPKNRLNDISSFFKKIYADLTYKPKRLRKELSVRNIILFLIPSIVGKRGQSFS